MRMTIMMCAIYLITVFMVFETGIIVQEMIQFFNLFMFIIDLKTKTIVIK